MTEFAGVDLLPSHRAGPLEALGTVEQCWADEGSFRVSGRLEKDNPQARLLFRRLQEGRRYGLSVGGRVRQAKWQYDPQAGEQVRVIEDVELDHIAVCRPEEAVNPDTYLTALAKAAGEVAVPPARETDLLAWLRQALVEAWRELWPLHKSEAETASEEGAALDKARARQEPPPAEAASETAVEPPLTARVESLERRLGELETRLEKAEPTAAPAEETPVTEPGRRQSLPAVGPARITNDNLWRGVL